MARCKHVMHAPVVCLRKGKERNGKENKIGKERNSTEKKGLHCCTCLQGQHGWSKKGACGHDVPRMQACDASMWGTQTTSALWPT
eukprot:1161522-Pelagomonas_calceolata.AAC.2